MSDLRMFDFV